MEIVIGGVSGVGKSTVGRIVADAIGARFIEGDDLHPAGNVEKMRRGIPLDDDDRAPWLARIAEVLANAHRDAEDVLVTCSALKRRYREQLRRACPSLRFVHLSADEHQLVARVATRVHNFMPAALLASQLDALELPTPQERAILVENTGTPIEVAALIITELTET